MNPKSIKSKPIKYSNFKNEMGKLGFQGISKEGMLKIKTFKEYVNSNVFRRVKNFTGIGKSIKERKTDYLKEFLKQESGIFGTDTVGKEFKQFAKKVASNSIIIKDGKIVSDITPDKLWDALYIDYGAKHLGISEKDFITLKAKALGSSPSEEDEWEAVTISEEGLMLMIDTAEGCELGKDLGIACLKAYLASDIKNKSTTGFSSYLSSNVKELSVDLVSIAKDIESGKDVNINDFYELLVHLDGESGAGIGKEVLHKPFIEYFSNINALKHPDVQGNNPLHWAAKLGSQEAFIAFLKILDEAGDRSLLDQVNHFNETPWDVVLKSDDLEFIENLLLYEGINKDSSIFKNLKKRFENEITRHKDNADFVSSYIEMRKVQNGDRDAYNKLLESTYKDWAANKIKEDTSIDGFIKSFQYFVIYSYDEASRDELNEASGKTELGSHIKKALNDSKYKVKNEKLDRFLNHIRKGYADWSIYKQKLISEEGQTSFEVFMRSKSYAKLLIKMLSFGDLSLIHELGEASNRLTIRDLLSYSDTDKALVNDVIKMIFARKDAYSILTSFGYKTEEIITLAKENVHALAEAGYLPQVITVLHECGCDAGEIATFVSTKDSHDRIPIHNAAEKGNLDEVIDSLKAAGFESDGIITLLSIKHDNGKAPLHWAASNSNVDKVILSLNAAECKADEILKLMSIKDNHSKTPLHWAASNGNLDKVILSLSKFKFTKKQIIEFVSATAASYTTPLHLAAEKGNLDTIIDALNAAGCKDDEIAHLISIQDIFGRTSLHFATLNDNIGEVIASLKTAGCTPNQIIRCMSIKDKSRNQRTSFHLAAARGNLDKVIDSLMTDGLAQSMTYYMLDTDKSVNTSFHLAAARGNLDKVIDSLSKANFTKNQITKFMSAMNESYRTPFRVAAENGNSDKVIDSLKNAGLADDEIKLLNS